MPAAKHFKTRTLYKQTGGLQSDVQSKAQLTIHFPMRAFPTQRDNAIFVSLFTVLY